jgi:hypothetical protein
MQKQQGFTWSLSPQNLPNLITKLQALEGNGWIVSVAQKKSKRSESQNARYWAFLTAFGNHLGYTKDEMHDLCKQKFLSEVVEINGEMFKVMKSTPNTKTDEFAQYMTMCEMWGAEQGFLFDSNYT